MCERGAQTPKQNWVLMPVGAALLELRGVTGKPPRLDSREAFLGEVM